MLFRDKKVDGRFLPKGKKGDNRWLTPWMFLNWAFIGVAIAVGVLLFYGLFIDVREPESDILTLKVIDCFSDAQYFNEEVLMPDFDFYKECGLSKLVLDESESYYLKISVEGDNQKKEFEIGKKDLELQCKLGKTVSKDPEKYPQCDERIFKTTNQNGDLFTINIFTASDQEGGRV